ncbi:hypothetical protein DFH09DRAFT_1269189 [Mycena vulgaris]|nr:hypothetical protein DFH09DRAFT_1269189 [Mycena vulgaris]
MQPCLVAQSDKILRSWVDLESTESTGVEVATATFELKTLFNATRGSSEEEDETKLKEDSYIRLERKERANAALIRNMVAPATETQRPGGIFFLHQSFGGPPTPLECSCAFYILRRRHTNRAFHGQNLYPYNPTHSILRLCWGWILAKVFSLYFVFALLPGDFCVWYTELGDSSWGLVHKFLLKLPAEILAAVVQLPSHRSLDYMIHLLVVFKVAPGWSLLGLLVVLLVVFLFALMVQPGEQAGTQVGSNQELHVLLFVKNSPF